MTVEPDHDVKGTSLRDGTARPPKRKIRPRATSEQERSERILERRQANRRSAKLSRERQANEIQSARAENARLKEEHRDLLSRLTKLEAAAREMSAVRLSEPQIPTVPLPMVQAMIVLQMWMASLGQVMAVRRQLILGFKRGESMRSGVSSQFLTLCGWLCPDATSKSLNSTGARTGKQASHGMMTSRDTVRYDIMKAFERIRRRKEVAMMKQIRLRRK
jgi:hypothetical protein